jgi:hypothetical protein
MPFEEAVGRLKAYDERVRKKKAAAGGVTADGQVLLTQAEWEVRFKKGGGETSSPQKNKPSSDGANCGQAGRGRGRGRGHGGTQSSGGGSGGGGCDKSHIKCFNCEEFCHYSTQCPYPKKKKAEAHLAQTDDTGPALLLAVTEAVQNAPGQGMDCGLVMHEERVWPRLMLAEKRATAGDLWYLDNGASNHMTGDRRKFWELDETVTGVVRFGDASSVQIMGKGSILFACKNGDQWLLDDVYYIPSLCWNMVSLGQLTETGHRVVMDNDDLEVFDKNPWRLVMKVRRTSNCLYRIELQLASRLVDPSKHSGQTAVASSCPASSRGCAMRLASSDI